ncbi:unnamed protein product, partial [Meganyctiphanes norvegica]
ESSVTLDFEIRPKLWISPKYLTFSVDLAIPGFYFPATPQGTVGSEAKMFFYKTILEIAQIYVNSQARPLRCAYVSVTQHNDQVKYRKPSEKNNYYITATFESFVKIQDGITLKGDIRIYEEQMTIAMKSILINTIKASDDTHCGETILMFLNLTPPNTNERVLAAIASSKFINLATRTIRDTYLRCDINTSSQPELILHAPSWLQSIQYNIKDANIIAAGLHNGQVTWWDVRTGGQPVESTPLSVSHAHTVTAVTWLAHKTRTELFSTSTDGQVLWWDTRKLSAPTDKLLLDPSVKEESDGGCSSCLSAICLEYEPTMPTKFMVATEQGKVVACNRRARNPQDRISLIYNAHISPIYFLQRNPFFLKNFMTVGDWTVKLWAEDFKESPILWTKPSPAQLRGGCWSASRSSVLFTARLDGALDAWDLLTSWSKPAATAQVVDEGLETVVAHEGGRLLAVGSQLGTLSLLNVPARLLTPSDKHEKAAFTAVLERETRRERVLEARHKEQRLRERVRGGQGRGGGGPPPNVGPGGGLGGPTSTGAATDDPQEMAARAIREAEEEYRKKVAEIKATIEAEEAESGAISAAVAAAAVVVTQPAEDTQQHMKCVSGALNIPSDEEPKSISSNGSAER